MKNNGKQTLLEMAKAIPVNAGRTKNDAALDTATAIAWLRGQVRQTQISKALWPELHSHQSSNRFYSWLCRSMRKAYEEGEIKAD